MGLDELQQVLGRLKGLSDDQLYRLRASIVDNAGVQGVEDEEDTATAQALELIDDEIDRRGDA